MEREKESEQAIEVQDTAKKRDLETFMAVYHVTACHPGSHST